jgi:hypothetical protein
MSALLNPAASTVPAPGKASSAVFMCWVYALHIYHPIFFKTTTMDWVHHVPVYILNSLMFSVRCGDAISLKCLILCGVPGGIDYLWQVLEGEGQLDRGKYKDWCASINMWMRVPLGCISGCERRTATPNAPSPLDAPSAMCAAERHRYRCRALLAAAQTSSCSASISSGTMPRATRSSSPC